MVSLIESLQARLERELGVKALGRVSLVDLSDIKKANEDFELPLPNCSESRVLNEIRSYYGFLGFPHVPKLVGTGTMWFNSPNSLIAVQTTFSDKRVQVTEFEFPGIRY